MCACDFYLYFFSSTKTFDFTLTLAPCLRCNLDSRDGFKLWLKFSCSLDPSFRMPHNVMYQLVPFRSYFSSLLVSKEFSPNTSLGSALFSWIHPSPPFSFVLNHNMTHLLKCRGELCTFRWSLQIQFRWCIPPKRLLKLHHVHAVSNYSVFFLTPRFSLGAHLAIFSWQRQVPKSTSTVVMVSLFRCLNPIQKAALFSLAVLLSNVACCLIGLGWSGFWLYNALVVQCGTPVDCIGKGS